MPTTPGLFGLKNTNRDFLDPETWGKNQFNSSFPTALGCFMHEKGFDAHYLKVKNGAPNVGNISIEDLFGQDPSSEDIYFAFESTFSRFQPLILGRLPGTDLIVSSVSDPGKQTRALEIKLTALPDKITSSKPENEYGSELVVRPDTIFYLCATLFLENKEALKKLFETQAILVADWADPHEVLGVMDALRNVLRQISRGPDYVQSPTLMQPIWKTMGQTPQLADQCLDMFVWSSLGFLDLIIENSDVRNSRILTRSLRTVVWVYKVLEDLAIRGRSNFGNIVDQLSYNSKNDKAFAANGTITQKYMLSTNLETPRIAKSDIKNIIIGGGQNHLRPERRFDAILVNSPEIFK